MAGSAEDPVLSDAEQTARELDRQDRRMVERLAQRGAVTAYDKWVLEQTTHSLGQDPLVELLPLSKYALPTHARKILSPELYVRLEALLAEVRLQNEAVVGLKASVAGVLLSGDPAVVDLRMRFRAWANDYVRARLAKSSPRDGGNPVKQFDRLYGELLPQLEDIATYEPTVNEVFMQEFMNYLPFRLFECTWGPSFRMDPLSPTLHTRWDVFVAPQDRYYCLEMARLYTWACAQDIRQVVRAARQRGLASSGLDSATIRARLASLASDLRELRPLVIRDHNPESINAEILPGLWASWFWGGAQNLGIVPVHDNERRRIVELHERRFSCATQVQHDGLLASQTASWIDVDAVSGEEPLALDLNLAVLEGLHTRIMDVFARFDLSSAYERVRADAVGEAGDVPPDQASLLATFAAVEAATKSEETARALEAVGGPPVRVPTMRLERFLASLERLHCEVRPGPGSEVVVYRDGGKHARIGRHLRNREVPSNLAQRVLRRLGVTLREWIAVLR